MFFLKSLTHPIGLHPSYFGPNTSEFIKDRLYNDVEGTCTGTDGYIIAVNNVQSIGSGTVEPGTGLATFAVSYQAIVFRPFKGEVLDGMVDQVNKMGFFAFVGPLQIFVSTHLLPADLKFDATAHPPSFADPDDATRTIQKGVRVRLKVVGTRISSQEMFAIGTIKEDYLGAQLG